MNSQPTLCDRDNECESTREWEYGQRNNLRAVSVFTDRIYSFRVGTDTDSIPHGGQTIAKSLAGRKESLEMNPVLALRVLGNSPGNREALDVLFSRCRRTLLLVAYRVLGDHNQAENAVQRCLQSAAFHNIPQFETEGAFRGWLVRVLIDVALFILQERKWAARVLKTGQTPSYPEFA